ncbi:hypothetical protein LCGC14_2039930, partial [marine sediment metagenome]
MQRLTPELTLFSSLQVLPGVTESQELDFNLARRSGVVINSISSQIHSQVIGDVTHLDRMVQEIDLDPDNILILNDSVLLGDLLVIDSSRLIRHRADFTGELGFSTNPNPQLEMDYRMLPPEQRPISITNLRHNAEYQQSGATASVMEGLFVIR